MADVIDELLQGGSVDPELLAQILRRESEHGLVGSLSGSKRMAPVGAQMREDAMGNAASIGGARQTEALKRWQGQMALLAKKADLEARRGEGEMNRANQRELQRMRGDQAMGLASHKADLKKPAGAGQTIADTAMNGIYDAKDKVDVLNSALKNVGILSSGLGANLGFIKGLPAYDLDAELEPVRAALAFDKLEEMRNKAAALGQKGSGLGQVTEREINLLMSEKVNLDPGQKPAQLRTQIKKAINHFQRIQRAWEQDLAKAKAMGVDIESLDSAGMGDQEPSIEELMQMIDSGGEASLEASYDDNGY